MHPGVRGVGREELEGQRAAEQATQIGGCGFWIGFGRTFLSGMSKNLP